MYVHKGNTLKPLKNKGFLFNLSVLRIKCKNRYFYYLIQIKCIFPKKINKNTLSEIFKNI